MNKVYEGWVVWENWQLEFFKIKSQDGFAFTHRIAYLRNNGSTALQLVVYESEDEASGVLEEIYLSEIFKDPLKPTDTELTLFSLEYNCDYPLELIKNLPTDQ